MGRYLKMAREHAKQIKYYYDNAGPLGHQQAVHYFNELSSLAGRASRSKNDKSDVMHILPLGKSARVQISEMEKRRDEWIGANEGDKIT